MQDEFIKELHARLKRPLPGAAAQYKMAHAVRRSYQVPPAEAKRAGVLALFYPHDRDWRIVLIERQSLHPADHHRGQISFPGGRFEQQDGLIVKTALRETEEEVGVRQEAVHILGPLSELYISVSNFLVSPFVGYAGQRPLFQRDEKEVSAILEVPFHLFQNPGNVRVTDMKIAENITLKTVPYFDVMGKIVWGATAMMISELLEVLKPGTC